MLLLPLALASDCPDVTFSTPQEARLLIEVLLSSAEAVDDTRKSIYNATMAAGCVGVSSTTYTSTDTGCMDWYASETTDMYTLVCDAASSGYNASGQVEIIESRIENCFENPYTAIEEEWSEVLLHDASGVMDPGLLTVTAAGYEDDSEYPSMSWEATLDATFADGTVWALDWYEGESEDTYLNIFMRGQRAEWPSCGILAHFGKEWGYTNTKEYWALETQDHSLLLDWEENSIQGYCSVSEWGFLTIDGVSQPVLLADWSPLTDADGDGDFAGESDCDDQNSDVNSCAFEVCDGVDNDCDGQIDEIAREYYTDLDGDGYGVDPVPSCELVEGLAALDGDCDDTQSDIHPGANDYDCDGIDWNCNGKDEGFGIVDSDRDGYGGTEGFDECWSLLTVSDDCDDYDSDINPGADEVCDRGSIDNDCDGLVNVDDDSLVDGLVLYVDGDGDGWGGEEVLVCHGDGYVSLSGDCDDAVGEVSPAGVEVMNGVDDDCDGLVDEGGTNKKQKQDPCGCSSGASWVWGGWVIGMLWLRRKGRP